MIGVSPSNVAARRSKVPTLRRSRVLLERMPRYSILSSVARCQHQGTAVLISTPRLSSSFSKRLASGVEKRSSHSFLDRSGTCIGEALASLPRRKEVRAADGARGPHVGRGRSRAEPRSILSRGRQKSSRNDAWLQDPKAPAGNRAQPTKRCLLRSRRSEVRTSRVRFQLEEGQPIQGMSLRPLMAGT
jgi:hypothetical protein